VYFSTVATPENARFVRAWRARRPSICSSIPSSPWRSYFRAAAIRCYQGSCAARTSTRCWQRRLPRGRSDLVTNGRKT
jgi:hypothetical protein